MSNLDYESESEGEFEICELCYDSDAEAVNVCQRCNDYVCLDCIRSYERPELELDDANWLLLLCKACNDAALN
jgi:hypothetical protein